MARGLSYADAVKILGGGHSKAATAVDRLTGGLLLAATGMGAGLMLNLFDAKGELARMSGQLVAGMADRARGLSRLERTDRLTAAHATVVVTAYFEAIVGLTPPFDRAELEVGAAKQVSLASGGQVRSRRLHALAQALLQADVPMPTPQLPYDAAVAALRGFYAGMSDAVLRFVTELPVWTDVAVTLQRSFAAALLEEVPDRAIRCYEELLRRLATDLPEVGYWTNQVSHQATHSELRALSRGLAGVGEILTRLSSREPPDGLREGLSRAYRAELGRPILPATEAPEGLRIPALEAIYVPPDFRVAEAGPTERIAEESWWAQQQVRDDLQEFLVGHFTGPRATIAPLLVLGQPGSGKSVLTRVLAARMPAAEFVVVRVVLREVPADVDLQSQLEYAIRAATGEDIAWPDLARSAAGALPVIMLDGFDELLQATGVNQTDYLERVATFQRREADQGRPTAALVTSRTAVADRARCAADTVVIRLEPFSETQIAQWLEVWNDANAPGLAARSLRPLPVEAVRVHADLATQPLLLMMLALYDSDSNALQLDTGQLGHGELYERLLRRFALREVGKSTTGLPEAELDREVEQELLQLSVVAFAMANRGRQWVLEADLEADFGALLPIPTAPPSAGLRAHITAAERVVGRFFFVHESQATRHEVRLRTYEFLHATFGEYLVARLVAHELADLVEAAESNAARHRPAAVEDGFLHAILSFSPLTARSTTVSFLEQLLASMPGSRRRLLRELLISMFHTSLYPRHETTYADYLPRRLTITSRHAHYSANLVLLAVLVGEVVTGKDLFPTPGDEGDIDGSVWLQWRSIALLWRSQLNGWHGLLDTLDMERTWEDDQRGIRLRLARGQAPVRAIDPYWTYRIPPGDPKRGELAWREHHEEALRRQYYFMCDRRLDIAAHAVEPLASVLGSGFTTFHPLDDGTAVSAAAALVRLWLAIDCDANSKDLIAAYDACVKIAIHGFAPDDMEARARFRQIVLRLLDRQRRTRPIPWLDLAFDEIERAARKDPSLREAIDNLLLTSESDRERYQGRWSHNGPG